MLCALVISISHNLGGTALLCDGVRQCVSSRLCIQWHRVSGSGSHKENIEPKDIGQILGRPRTQLLILGGSLTLLEAQFAHVWNWHSNICPTYFRRRWSKWNDICDGDLKCDMKGALITTIVLPWEGTGVWGRANELRHRWGPPFKRVLFLTEILIHGGKAHILEPLPQALQWVAGYYLSKAEWTFLWNLGWRSDQSSRE